GRGPPGRGAGSRYEPRFGVGTGVGVGFGEPARQPGVVALALPLGVALRRAEAVGGAVPALHVVLVPGRFRGGWEPARLDAGDHVVEVGTDPRRDGVVDAVADPREPAALEERVLGADRGGGGSETEGGRRVGGEREPRAAGGR